MTIKYFSRQDRADYLPPRAIGSGFKILAGYRPAPEWGDSPGQDFIYCRADDSKLVFVVCDGVSGSFQGQLAAEFVGFRLGDHLWFGRTGGQRITKAELLTSRAGIRAFLDGLVDEGTRGVDKTLLPQEMDGIVQQALLAKKAQGMQTVLAAGQVFWNLNSFSALLMQLGNVAIESFSRRTGRRKSAFKDPSDDRNRWSSVHGTMGTLKMMYKEKLTHLAAYTDGLGMAVNALGRKAFSQAAVRAAVSRGLIPEPDDDIAFICVQTNARP